MVACGFEFEFEGVSILVVLAALGTGVAKGRGDFGVIGSIGWKTVTGPERSSSVPIVNGSFWGVRERASKKVKLLDRLFFRHNNSWLMS